MLGRGYFFYMVYSCVYDCIYSASGKVRNEDNEVTDVNIPLGHYACFAAVYSELRRGVYGDIDYKIYLYANDLKGKNFNLCNKLETKKILRCLKRVVPFSYFFSKGIYTIGQYNREKTDFIILNINIKGNFAQHLWVTTMLRCFFEYPYNVAAKESCVLQSEIKEVDGFNFENENWINLYLTIADILGSTACHGIVNHGSAHPLAKTYQEWNKLMSNIKDTDDIYKQLNKNSSHKIEQKICVRENTVKSEKLNRASLYTSAYKDKLSWKKK